MLILRNNRLRVLRKEKTRMKMRMMKKGKTIKLISWKNIFRMKRI